MESNKHFAFKRTNFILLAIGMAIVIIGFVIMSGPGSSETSFNPSIFDARHIKIAPVVCLLGYLFMIFAIVFSSGKNTKKVGDEPVDAEDNKPQE